jgi:hypothetical protein
MCIAGPAAMLWWGGSLTKDKNAQHSGGPTLLAQVAKLIVGIANSLCHWPKLWFSANRGSTHMKGVR